MARLDGYFSKAQKKQLWNWIKACAPDRIHSPSYWHMADINRQVYDVYIDSEPLREPKTYRIVVYKDNDKQQLYMCRLTVKQFKRKLK